MSEVKDKVRSKLGGTDSHTLRLASRLACAANVAAIVLTVNLKDNNITDHTPFLRVHFLFGGLTGVRLSHGAVVTLGRLFLLEELTRLAYDDNEHVNSTICQNRLARASIANSKGITLRPLLVICRHEHYLLLKHGYEIKSTTSRPWKLEV